jgi:hypothetical protein
VAEIAVGEATAGRIENAQRSVAISRPLIERVVSTLTTHSMTWRTMSELT